MLSDISAVELQIDFETLGQRSSMMANRRITHEEAEEIARLEAEHLDATTRAAEAMRTGGTALGEIGSWEQRADIALLRIREIRGVYPLSSPRRPLFRSA